MSKAETADVLNRLRARAQACFVTGNHIMGEEFNSYADEITKLREELKTARTWQKIGTAPKDRKVLLFGKDGLSIHNWNHFHVYNQPRFTHWMPLPEPPTSISSTEPVETME